MIESEKHNACLTIPPKCTNSLSKSFDYFIKYLVPNTSTNTCYTTLVTWQSKIYLYSKINAVFTKYRLMFLATRSACKFYFVQATMPGNVPSEIKEDRDSDSPKKSDSQHYKQSHLITMEVYFFLKFPSALFSHQIKLELLWSTNIYHID